MNRREIINELQQIVALTDPLLASKFGPSVPEAAQRAKGLIREVESWQQQPAELASTVEPLPFAEWRKQQELAYKQELAYLAGRDPAAAERHIDTPDELLELLAGISSDPQVEGLSLAQKASSMALLHIANALEHISYQLEDIDTSLEQIGIRLQPPDSPQEPS